MPRRGPSATDVCDENNGKSHQLNRVGCCRFCGLVFEDVYYRREMELDSTGRTTGTCIGSFNQWQILSGRPVFKNRPNTSSLEKKNENLRHVLMSRANRLFATARLGEWDRVKDELFSIIKRACCSEDMYFDKYWLHRRGHSDVALATFAEHAHRIVGVPDVSFKRLLEIVEARHIPSTMDTHLMVKGWLNKHYPRRPKYHTIRLATDVLNRLRGFVRVVVRDNEFALVDKDDHASESLEKKDDVLRAIFMTARFLHKCFKIYHDKDTRCGPDSYALVFLADSCSIFATKYRAEEIVHTILPRCKATTFDLDRVVGKNRCIVRKAYKYILEDLSWLEPDRPRDRRLIQRLKSTMPGRHLTVPKTKGKDGRRMPAFKPKFMKKLQNTLAFAVVHSKRLLRLWIKHCKNKEQTTSTAENERRTKRSRTDMMMLESPEPLAVSNPPSEHLLPLPPLPDLSTLLEPLEMPMLGGSPILMEDFISSSSSSATLPPLVFQPRLCPFYPATSPTEFRLPASLNNRRLLREATPLTGSVPPFAAFTPSVTFSPPARMMDLMDQGGGEDDGESTTVSMMSMGHGEDDEPALKRRRTNPDVKREPGLLCGRNFATVCNRRLFDEVSSAGSLPRPRKGVFDFVSDCGSVMMDEDVDSSMDLDDEFDKTLPDLTHPPSFDLMSEYQESSTEKSPSPVPSVPLSETDGPCLSLVCAKKAEKGSSRMFHIFQDASLHQYEEDMDIQDRLFSETCLYERKDGKHMKKLTQEAMKTEAPEEPIRRIEVNAVQYLMLEGVTVGELGHCETSLLKKLGSLTAPDIELFFGVNPELAEPEYDEKDDDQAEPEDLSHLDVEDCVIDSVLGRVETIVKTVEHESQFGPDDEPVQKNQGEVDGDGGGQALVLDGEPVFG